MLLPDPPLLGEDRYTQTCKVKFAISSSQSANITVCGVTKKKNLPSPDAFVRCIMVRSAAAELFPLEKVSEHFPEEVDTRLVTASFASSFYVGLCQMVRTAALCPSLFFALCASLLMHMSTSRIARVHGVPEYSRLPFSHASLHPLRVPPSLQVYSINERAGEAIELAANHPGLTPLMLAALEGDVPAARMLLQRGASVGLTNCYGRTALMMAAATGHLPMIRLLLSVGAATEIVDAWQRTAAGWARARGHLHLVPLLEGAAVEQRERQRQLVRRQLRSRDHSRDHQAGSAAAAGHSSSHDPTGFAGYGEGEEEEEEEEEAYLVDEEARFQAEMAREHARDALALTAMAEEDVRQLQKARRHAVEAAAAAARDASAAAGRSRVGGHTGGSGGGWGIGGLFSSRGSRQPSGRTRSPRDLFEGVGENAKPTPPPGAYELDPRAERIRDARRSYALVSRGVGARVLSAGRPPTRAELLRNRPAKGYLSGRRAAGASSSSSSSSPSSSAASAVAAGKRERSPSSPSSPPRVPYAPKVDSHGGYANRTGLAYQHAAAAAAAAGGGGGGGGGGYEEGRGLSKVESALLAPPKAAAGWPAPYRQTGTYLTSPETTPESASGGVWGWLGGDGGDGGDGPTGGRGSSRAGGGKHRDQQEESGGPVDEAEIAAVRRRYDPEWGPLARGAVTDPTRFLGYTPREDSSDADEDAAYMGRSTRSFWDSARGQAMLGGTPDDPITTPRRKEMLASQKRRMWITSSRRWVEGMKAKGPMAPEERRKAQRRLYTQSARAGAKPRVYC